MKFKNKKQQAAVMAQYGNNDPVKKYGMTNLPAALESTQSKYQRKLVRADKQPLNWKYGLQVGNKTIFYPSKRARDQAFEEKKKNCNNPTNLAHQAGCYKIQKGINPTKSHTKAELMKMSYNQLKKAGYKFKSTDDDGDGVSNSKDCKPLDPNKQGFLHDLVEKGKDVITVGKEKYTEFRINQAKAAEEKAESLREKQEARLEDQRDRARQREAEYRARQEREDSRNARLKALQKERAREEAKLQELQEHNARLKAELDKNSAPSRFKRYMGPKIKKAKKTYKQVLVNVG